MTWFPQTTNNVKYWWTKIINLLLKIGKVESKQIFFQICLANVKYWKKHVKMTKINQKWPFLDIIWHCLTFKKRFCFVTQANQLTLFDRIWYPNKKLNLEFFFQIIFTIELFAQDCNYHWSSQEMVKVNLPPPSVFKTLCFLGPFPEFWVSCRMFRWF